MMNEYPLVSVIVPCYNIAHFVAETIRSVIAQTYPNWELILIDDGSKDHIAEIIQPFLEDNRIQFHVRENRGVSATRNHGVALAKGDFIAFLDGDDVWQPEKLFRQLDIFKHCPNVGICGTGYVPIDRRNTPLGKPILCGKGLFPQASAAIVSQTLIIPLSSAVIRKTCCEHVQSQEGYLFDESISSLSEDFDFWLRCSAWFTFYQIDEPLLRYRVWQGNATSSIWLKRQKTILEKIIPQFRSRYGSVSYVRNVHICRLKSLFYHERGSHFSTRLAKTHWFIRSLLCNPSNRDAWGALGHQALPKCIYGWIAKWFR